MPAGGFKTFVAGEILTASDVNSFLMQGVLVFDDDADRTAQLPSPVAGQVSYRKDDDLLEAYDGTDWVPVRPRPVASGGTESDITVNGEPYRLHTFTSNGTFTVTRSGPVDVVIVGGGASGGARDITSTNSGGGGGGGVGEFTVDLDAGSYSVVIGAGGAGVSDSYGNNGNVSEMGPLSLDGGGAGGRGSTATGFGLVDVGHANSAATGGGGGLVLSHKRGEGCLPFGRRGGNSGTFSSPAGSVGGGGGGGANGNGGNGSGSVGGAGGAGRDVSAFLGQSASTTVLGGGGGGQRRTGSVGSGGAGGGTNGATTGASGAAGANTGGGSGGGATSSGNGGSGIVYVRYRK